MAHPEFYLLTDICRDLIIQMNYYSTENFTGEIVPGYQAKKAYMAKVAALHLAKVQEMALSRGLSLKIFDSYRPVKAVQFFQDWAQRLETNPELKKRFYPKFERQELLEKGFIAKHSSHSRGCATDLTLVDLKTGKDLDMGSEFDCFDEISHTQSILVTSEQMANRRLLLELMESQGFKNFHQEWWHFSFRPEPFPNQYFDFDIV
jgi:D-alanyl-D-alanine dipeptidase